MIIVKLTEEELKMVVDALVDYEYRNDHEVPGTSQEAAMLREKMVEILKKKR